VVSARPLIAVTGRTLGARERWPYADAAALPRAYLDAVRRAGAQPVVVDPASTASTGLAAATDLLARFDGLLLTGGPDVDPARYGAENHPETYGVDRHADDLECSLARAAIEASVPTLAICRGIQIVNVALGGTLHQHIPEEPGVAAHGAPGKGERLEHDVALDDDSLVARVMGTTAPRCSCHHHQAVAGLGEGLRVVGRAADGIVEAVALDGVWLLAVQWHPEDTAPADPAQQALFDALAVQATRVMRR
jgi:putative glutamine amidotransferase